LHKSFLEPALAGLLLPSAVITCLLTAGFLQVEHVPAVQATLKGIIPATAGITLVVGLRFAQPLFRVTSQEGIVRLSISTTIILACALAIIVLQLTVILVLPCAALTGMILFTSWRERNLAGSQIEGE
jgi:chromate transporter